MSLSAAALAVVVAVLPAAAQDELKEFTNREGRFTVKMPGEPKESIQTVQTAVGPIDAHNFIIERDDHAFGVVWNDYPDQVLQADPAKVLAGARDGSVNNLRGKLLNEKDVKISGHPGKEYEYEFPTPDGKQARGRCKLFLVNKRLYQVMVLGEAEAVQSKTADNFMASFKLTGEGEEK